MSKDRGAAEATTSAIDFFSNQNALTLTLRKIDNHVMTETKGLLLEAKAKFREPN